MHGQFYEYGKFILTESDKQKHFVAGVVISGISYEFGLKKFEDKKKGHHESSLIAADGVHPNAKCYSSWAENLGIKIFSKL